MPKLLFVLAAIIAFVVGVVLLVTGEPSGKLLWGILYVGLACLAASLLPYERWIV